MNYIYHILPIATTFGALSNMTFLGQKCIPILGMRLTWFQCLKKNYCGCPWVPDPPSLAQMTFTQCTSMSELKFDSGAPSGGQIYQYVSFSALFKSLTKDMAQKYGSTVKNLTLHRHFGIRIGHADAERLPIRKMRRY